MQLAINVIVVTHPSGLYQISKCDARGHSVYKSDTNRMDMLQLLCINSAWADQRHPYYSKRI